MSLSPWCSPVTINTFGDSHCNSGFRAVSIPHVQINRHHVGARLMHSIGRDGLGLNFPLNASDWLLLSFGEIDCRCHVKRITQDGRFQSTIDRIVAQFESAVVAAAVPCKIAIYNIVPPPRRETVREDPSFPFVGDDSERLSYIKYMNGCLKEICNRNSWLFFDVYRPHSDEEGYLNHALSDGVLHIEEPRHLAEFIRRHMLS